MQSVSQASAESSQVPPTFVLRLEPHAYRIAWSVCFLLHVYCGVHLAAMAELYWHVDHPYLVYFADLLAPESDRHFGIVGAIFLSIGVIHGWCLCEMIIVSLLLKELGMAPFSIATWLRRRVPTPSRIQSQTTHRSTVSRPRIAFFSIVGKSWERVFGRRGLFGVESDGFDDVFAGREVLEIAFQSYQAYRTSQMIARAWINSFFVALVVLNCWSTPLLQYTFRHRAALGRLACITTDLVLNVFTNMVIPWLLFYSYYLAYDPEQYSFELSLLYDDVWFTNLVLENRLLFALSTIDFISKLLPHVTILFCLSAAKSLLVSAPPNPGTTHGSSSSRVHAIALDSAATNKSIGVQSHRGPLPVATTRHRKQAWRTITIHLAFLAWGTALLFFHFQASRLSITDGFKGCKQSIRPWFTKNIACATYEYNCYRLQDQLDITHALEQIDPTTLVSLIISHCQDLVVPPTLRNFSNLLSLELYNVSLQQWGRDAAISPVIHTSLVALLLIHVNMTALPEGIVLELPAALTDIEIAYTNLTTLPDDLHEIWHPMAVLYFEFSQVREFPSTLKQLEIYDLSLIGNHMETVPALAELPFEYYFLALSHNPLRELPSEITGGGVFGFLALEHTAVAAIPAWAGNGDMVYAQGSPVCDDGLASSAAPLPANAVCEEADPRGGGRYPLSIMSPRRMV